MKVFVGLSGGVDSSVSAVLLREQGHEVTGVFIRAWKPPFMECSISADRESALHAAVSIGIPFRELDLSDLYKKEVVDYMIEEYRSGRTPNPDVMCNRHVKFGGFFKWAMNEGADFIATGHYSQIRQAISSSGRNTFELHQSADPNKDQSYFLWTLREEQLSKVMFPVGGFTKDKVREEARRFGLPAAEKKDSQGLCFLGKFDVKEFLVHFVDERPGIVQDLDGNAIGVHRGAMFFTLGERHGFTVTKKLPNDGPWYVVAKDIDANIITVAQRNIEKPVGASTHVILEQVNWINGVPEAEKKYQCRFRYRQPLRSCVIDITNNETRVMFETPQEYATPGQSLVIYDHSRVVGGGSIKQ